MPVTYTNRKGSTYTLCQTTTKTGKPRYAFVREPTGREVLDALPEGWEIRESLNGVVSLSSNTANGYTSVGVKSLRILNVAANSTEVLWS